MAGAAGGGWSLRSAGVGVGWTGQVGSDFVAVVPLVKKPGLMGAVVSHCDAEFQFDLLIGRIPGRWVPPHHVF